MQPHQYYKLYTHARMHAARMHTHILAPFDVYTYNWHVTDNQWK